ncbi:MAG: hypothetical protein KIS66_13835 [Fimbriimonadaceae bacterium]|nr:hypothetical protein [Fimbriimonadaceae bacterium]
MPVPFKPHTASWRAATNASATAPGFAASPTSVACYVEPVSSESAYRDTMIELRNPFRLYCDLGTSFANGVKVGDKVTFDGFDHVVRALSKQSAGLALDHLKVTMERTEGKA